MKTELDSTVDAGLLERSVHALGLPLWVVAQFLQFLGGLYLVNLAFALLGNETQELFSNPWFPIGGATFYAASMTALALIRMRARREP